jgi:hypothetical protein
MKKLTLILALIALLLSACATPTPEPTAVPSNTPKPTATATFTPTPKPTATATITLTPTPAAEQFQAVTFAETVTCRMGPKKNYFAVMTYQAGDTAELNGRSEDGTWVMVSVSEKNKDPYCWVPLASIEYPGDMGSLQVPLVGPLPDAPQSLTAPNGVCGSGSALILRWTPVTAGAGYYIYRNGTLINTTYDDQYRDFDTPQAKKAYTYTYMVQAFNAFGTSEGVAGITVTLCGR